MAGIRLLWDGKSAEIPRLHLPRKVVETESAAADQDLAKIDGARARR